MGAPSNQSFLDALWAIPEGLEAATGGGYPEEASAAYNAHKSKALDDLKAGRITKDEFDRIKGAAGSQFLIGNYVNKEAHPNLNAVLSGGANALYQMFDRDESPLDSLSDWYQQQRGVGYGMLDNISNKQATTTPMYPEEASAAYPEGLKAAAVVGVGPNWSQVAYKMPVNAEGYNTEPFWYPLYGDTWGWVGPGAVIVDPNETWYKGAHKEDTTHWGDYLSSSIYKGSTNATSSLSGEPDSEAYSNGLDLRVEPITTIKEGSKTSENPWTPGSYNEAGHLLLSDPASVAKDLPYYTYDPQTELMHMQGGRVHPDAKRVFGKGDAEYDRHIQNYNTLYNQTNPTGPGADWQGGVWRGTQSDTPLGLQPVASMKPPEDWAGGVLTAGYEGFGQLQPYTPRPNMEGGIASLAAAPSTPTATEASPAAPAVTSPFSRSGYTGAMVNPYMYQQSGLTNPYTPLNFGNFSSPPMSRGYPNMGRYSGIAAFMLGY